MKQSDRVKLLKDSWYRCYEQGVDKKLREVQKYIDKNELEKRKLENSDLIKLFKEEIDLLIRKYVVNKYFLFLLTDSEGVLILKYFCNHNEKDCDYQIKEGSYFTEDSYGTNAISLAMEVNDSIYLRGDEHYCDCFYNWECIATPILVNDKIIGYLDMSLLNKEIAEKDKMLFELLLSKLVTKMIKIILFSKQEKIILDQLTEQVLKLSAMGYKITEISDILHISHSSVKYHRSKVCELLEARNLYHAIAKSIKYRCFDLKVVD